MSPPRSTSPVVAPAAALAAVARTFGPGAADAKLRVLRRAALAARAGDIGPDDAAEFRRLLDFVRAYPDGRPVLRAAEDLIAALPPAPPVVHPFSWGTVQRLVRIREGSAEIAWDDVDDEIALSGVMELLATSAETPGVLDPDIPFREWFARCRPAAHATDLAYFVALLEASGHPPMLQTHLFEQCALPVRWDGPPSCAIRLDVYGRDRLHLQRTPFERERFPLAREIRRRPLEFWDRLKWLSDRAFLDVAVQALAARSLEIYALFSAEPFDFLFVDGPRGLRVMFAGVVPDFRDALETHGFFLVTKNGVPLGYGPVGAFLGCAEMGINLFPEFRGAEIRSVWALVMRAMHHIYGVEHFFLTRYGMGEGNPEAIDSGAFWFYRKLGFLPDNPKVEALAREEEARIAADPSHRSSRAMLRRLSHTAAHFTLDGDFSEARRQPFPFELLAVAVSRFVGREFGADRASAERECAKRVRRLLPIRDEEFRVEWSLRTLAPVLAMIPDLARWTKAERAALARIVEAKGAPHEGRAARLFCGHACLEAALRELARTGNRE